MGRCQICGTELSDSEKFCGVCGAPIAENPGKGKVCSHCGTMVNEKQIFCPHCGYRMQANLQEHPQQQVQTKMNQAADMENKPAAASQPKTVNGNATPAARNPEIHSGGSWLLAIICLLFFWPVAIYSITCISKAKKTTSQIEVDELLKKSNLVSVIGIAVGAVVLVFLVM